MPQSPLPPIDISRLDSEYCELEKSRALLRHLIAKHRKRPEALANSEFVSELIDDLFRNLPSHFEREEHLLAAISHPGLETRRSVHFNLREELSEICFGLLQEDSQTTRKPHAFLTSKLQKHLLGKTGNYDVNC